MGRWNLSLNGHHRNSKKRESGIHRSIRIGSNRENGMVNNRAKLS
jgi:hypothetical protein